MATSGDRQDPFALRAPDPWELAVVWQSLRRHLWPSCAIVLGCLVLGILAMLLPRSYIAEASLAYDPQTPLIRGGGDLPMTDPLRDAQIDAQLAQATSLAVAEAVARTVDVAADPDLQRQADALAAHSDRPLSREEALGTALLDHVTARRVGQTPTFTISVTAATAAQAARLANSFAAAYLDAAVQQKSAQAAASAQQIGIQTARLRRQAAQAEADLAAFRLANNLLDVPDSATLNAEAATLHGQLADARGQAALARTRSAAANATTIVGGGNGGMIDTTPVSALTEQRATVAAELAALLGHEGEKHPDVINARRKLAEVDAQLAQAIAGNAHSAAAEALGTAAKASALAASLHDAQTRIAAGLGHDARLLDLQNGALAARQAYQDVLKISADQTAGRALLQPDAQQIGIATPPLRPRFPRLGINLLVALLLGLGISAIVALIRESWLQTLGSVADIDRWLEADHFAPLAMFPPRPRPKLPFTRRSGTCDPVEAVLLHPHSAFATGIRSLGNAALFTAGSDKGTGGRVIGITSAVAGEGKTTVSTAMGRVLAATGMRVALLAWPSGTTAAPDNDGSTAAPDRAHLIDRSGLALVSSGIPGTWTEADCEAKQFTQMVSVLRGEYEVVIINIPPVLAGSANRQLLECIDALVLLVRWRSTPVRAVREALHRIATAGGHVSGVALSMVQ